MKRGEAMMAHYRNACRIARGRNWRLACLIVAPLLVLLPMRSGANPDEAPSGAGVQPAVADTMAPPAPAPPVVPATAQTAAVTAPAARQPDDRQRRVLMLLLMNSAGPVRPYGNLGR